MFRSVIFGVFLSLGCFSLAFGQDYGYNNGVPQVEQGQQYAQYGTAQTYAPPYQQTQVNVNQQQVTPTVNPYQWRPAQNLQSPFATKQADFTHRHDHYHHQQQQYYHYYQQTPQVQYYYPQCQQQQYYYYQYPHANRYWIW